MTKISRASLRSYTTTHLTYRPPDEARKLLHEHANTIILRAGKALAEILPESEASAAALDALSIARMRCNQAIAHDECDVDEAKARLAKAAPHRGIAEVFQAAAKEMGEALAATGKAIGKLAVASGDPELLRSLGLKGQVVLSQSIHHENPEGVFDGMAERMKANAAKMKRVSLRDLDYGQPIMPEEPSDRDRAIIEQFVAPLQRIVPDGKAERAVTTPVANATDTFDVQAFVSSSGARVEHHSISAERLVEWARDNLAKAEHVEEVREWIDRDAWHLRIDGASFTNGHGGHVVVRRNLDGTLPQGKAPADEHRGIYGKYFVRRADGRDDRHCSYFVLRMDDGRKPWDVAALQAYADALPKAYAKLATDIRAIITEIEEEVDAEFAGDLPEGFDRHEALSELAGYGFENGTLLKCSDAELSHLVGQWRRFKAANTKAAEAKALAGLREIFGKFDLSADEAVESVRILAEERNTIDAAISKSIAETPLSNDGTLIERLGRRLREADSDHLSYRAFAGLHDDVVSACRGLIEAARALGCSDEVETAKVDMERLGRGEPATLLAEVGAATTALSKSKEETESLRNLLAEVGALLLGPAGSPTEANVLGEAKALRDMVDGDHRLSAAFGQAGRRAEVKAKALSLLKQESADVDAEVKKLEGLLIGLDTGNPRTREDLVIALVEEAKRIRHLVAGMGCPSKLSDIIAGRAERASASNKDAFERGRADGQADVAARLRKLLDPSDEHKLSLDGLLKSVGYLVRVEDSLNAVVSPDGKAPVRVDCPPEGMLVRRAWNGVRLGGDAEEVTPLYLCARDGGWEWHDGDEKWRSLSAHQSTIDEAAGRVGGILEIRDIARRFGANRHKLADADTWRDIDALTFALTGKHAPAFERTTFEERLSMLGAASVIGKIRDDLAFGANKAQRRIDSEDTLAAAERNQWIVDNKLWGPQEATPVGGSRLRVPNVSVFAEAAPGVAVSVTNPVPVMVGVERGHVVSYAVNVDGPGGEVFVNGACWGDEGPITIRRVIE